ncbi:hypothetical protein ASZ90_009364 [hydrocarbon metagenome]|uniref:Uncharacterized protein n=1 Tax=hydrocarbon metagenome TaxID=938273 RepID=A0A0W8FJG4_9ZZZZ
MLHGRCRSIAELPEPFVRLAGREIRKLNRERRLPCGHVRRKLCHRRCDRRLGDRDVVLLCHRVALLPVGHREDYREERQAAVRGIGADLCDRQADGVVSSGLIGVDRVLLIRRRAVPEVPGPACRPSGREIGELDCERRLACRHVRGEVCGQGLGNRDVSLLCCGVAAALVRHGQADGVVARRLIDMLRALHGGVGTVAKLPEPFVRLAGGLVRKRDRKRRLPCGHIRGEGCFGRRHRRRRCRRSRDRHRGRQQVILFVALFDPVHVVDMRRDGVRPLHRRPGRAGRTAVCRHHDRLARRNRGRVVVGPDARAHPVAVRRKQHAVDHALGRRGVALVFDRRLHDDLVALNRFCRQPGDPGHHEIRPAGIRCWFRRGRRRGRRRGGGGHRDTVRRGGGVAAGIVCDRQADGIVPCGLIDMLRVLVR